MADYIPILNTQIEPQAPVTSELMFQLRDNPEAIAEGAVGASRIQFAALGPLTAGDSIRKRREGALSGTGSGNYADILTHGFLQEGTIRCVIEDLGGQMGDFRIARSRNGVSTTVVAQDSGLGTLTADVSVIHGDILKIQAEGDATTASGTVNAYMKISAGGNLWVGNGSDNFLEQNGV